MLQQRTLFALTAVACVPFAQKPLVCPAKPHTRDVSLKIGNEGLALGVCAPARLSGVRGSTDGTYGGSSVDEGTGCEA